MSKDGQKFDDLNGLTQALRTTLETKDTVLLYAHNGTGKTRLSMEFKEQGKRHAERDTLYFNAFTEDLFHWNNDLDDDTDRRLVINKESRFFEGLVDLEMDNRIRPLVGRYADFEFRIDTENSEWCVRFFRVVNGEHFENIKVSRGEENIFIWCFFLAILELAMDSDLATYNWVKYVYVDDPISSLDEHNAISVANHLARILSQRNRGLKVVVSTHHTLFFNVLFNELKGNKTNSYVLNRGSMEHCYVLRKQSTDTPYFHHVAALKELYDAVQEDRLYTYHFNMLRSILEKTASFHGYGHFSVCIKKEIDDADGILHTRIINILSHGNYSLYEPLQMIDENKRHFKEILEKFLIRYPFNLEVISESSF